MCRLFGYKTKNSKKTNNLLIKSLMDFRDLSKYGCVPCGIKKGHNDGWGIILYKNKVPCLYYRSTMSIMNDNNFDNIIDLIKNIKPDIVVSHLRKMSKGKKTIENTQPFISNNFSLAHNGTILYPDLNKNDNKSDSLKFFNNVISQKDIISQSYFKDIYTFTYLNNNFTSMNMVFSDGSNLFAIKNINSKHVELDKLGFNKYYTLSSFKNEDCLFICSEKISAFDKMKAESLKNIKIYKY
ncbi:MAG TPA: class II glutamine amidotransferase [Candidatus Paceibacterota bacterium]